MKTTTPSYFLTPGDPAIENHRKTFEPFNDPEINTLLFNVHRALIDGQDASKVQEIILALQHYPKLIPKLLFSLDFTFSQTEHSSLHIAKRIWKQDPSCYQWFSRLLDVPFMLFFIQDEDIRFYALAGDLLATGDLHLEETFSHGIAGLALTKDKLQILRERLFNSCLSFLVFCHGSGFNPEIYVQGLLASFEASFSYEDVLCEYANDVLKGTFRVSIPHHEDE